MPQHLPAEGYLRLKDIIAPNGPIPVGKSTWWEGVKSGRYPKPVKIGLRATAWRVQDIRSLIRNGPTLLTDRSEPPANNASLRAQNSKVSDIMPRLDPQGLKFPVSPSIKDWLSKIMHQH